MLLSIRVNGLSQKLSLYCWCDRSTRSTTSS